MRGRAGKPGGIKLRYPLYRISDLFGGGEVVGERIYLRLSRLSHAWSTQSYLEPLYFLIFSSTCHSLIAIDPTHRQTDNRNYSPVTTIESATPDQCLNDLTYLTEGLKNVVFVPLALADLISGVIPIGSNIASTRQEQQIKTTNAYKEPHPVEKEGQKGKYG